MEAEPLCFLHEVTTVRQDGGTSFAHPKKGAKTRYLGQKIRAERFATHCPLFLIGIKSLRVKRLSLG